jgi:hypothetical protein
MAKRAEIPVSGNCYPTPQPVAVPWAVYLLNAQIVAPLLLSHYIGCPKNESRCPKNESPFLTGRSQRSIFTGTSHIGCPKNLTNVAYGTGPVSEIFLQPLDGRTVVLNSLDLGAWSQPKVGGLTIVDGSNNVLFSTGLITIGMGSSLTISRAPPASVT